MTFNKKLSKVDNMNKTLILAEKPSVAREIARVLKCKNNKGSYIEGERYIVTWALGHLVSLADPEEYDKKYKTWSFENLPMIPKNTKFIVLKKTSKQFYEVKKLLNSDKVSDIVIATDAGREGELVARLIIEKSNVKKPMKRLWISSQTDKAIIEGFKNLKDASRYNNLYKAALCRAEADWLVGLNATRALTCKYNAQLSAGRVQSPTLAMIVSREEEINSFKPKPYYTIKVKANGFYLDWINKDNNKSIFNEEFANKIKNKIYKKDGIIVDIKETHKKTFSPLLYDLTELQKDANRIWGYSAKQTLSIMQRLYENHKALTYPRTDSRYISKDIVETLKDRLQAINTGSYRIIASEILKNKVNTNKNFVDDSKVSDHHAIIPTEEKANVLNLNTEERHIYDLVVKRFLSVMLKPFEYIQTDIIVDINGERFKASGKVVKNKGWKVVYDKNDLEDSLEDDNQILPKLNKGDKISVLDIQLNCLKTKVPSRFNEGTLLKAMENPQKYININSREYAKTLGETGGLGTVATRADIIDKLFNSYVIEKKGREIYPTSKGKQLIQLVPRDLKSPLLTAKWEKDLEDISKGKLSSKEFINSMRDYSKDLVLEIKKSSENFIHDNKTGNKCPNCGKYLLEVKGKNGTVMNVCQDRSCGFKEVVSRITNARCPECKKKLELRGHGNSKIYVCTGTNCNFREKESQFKKRFENNDKVNKREVNKIMQKMKKEASENINNPFANLMDMFNQK